MRPRINATSGPSSPHYVYLLHCADNSFHVGISASVSARVVRRQVGDGSLLIEGPYILRDAISREQRLKSWSHRKMEQLIARSARAIARLRREINGMGGWALCGDMTVVNQFTERELRDHLKMLRDDARDNDAIARSRPLDCRN